KEQLWDAIVLLLKVMALDRPVLFVLDDLQWADRESIGLFTFAARNITDVPVLLIGISRSDPSVRETAPDPSALVEAIRQLKIEGKTIELTLGRLSADETRKLVEQTLGNKEIDGGLARRMYAATAGNPLFASELANLMKLQGAVALAGERWGAGPAAASLRIPERVYDVIAQRLARLSAPEREMMEIAACEGQHFTSDTLAACLRIDRLSLLRQLQALEQKHALIRYENARYRFDHPLVRQVLYEGILPELREEYHRMIAEWLTAHAADNAADASQTAHHLLASRQEEAAAPYLLRAAGHARSLWANAEALEYYRQAHGILNRQGADAGGMLLQAEEGLGDIALASGMTAEASAHYARMLELARSLGDRGEEIGALRKSAESLRVQGRSQEALRLCTEALQRAQALAMKGEQTECLNTLAFIHSARGEYEQSLRLSEEALGLARSHADTRSTATSLSNLGFARMHRGEYQLAADRLTEAKTLQEYIGDRKGLAGTLNYLALVHHRLGHFDTALEVARASYEIKQSIADAAAIPGTINIMGDVYRDMGDLESAITQHRQSLQLARQQGNRGSECDNLRDLGADCLARGELEEARRYLELVLAIAREHGYTWYETRGYITLAEYHLLSGSLGEAEALLQRGREMAGALKAQELIMEAEWKSALLRDRQGDHAEAVVRLRAVIAIASASGNLPLLWPMYRDLGAILEKAGDRAGGLEARSHAARRIAEVAGGIRDEAARNRFLGSTGV
ncbi:MAG TPA: tetratricopeptide repeat protein, partial [Bacteroidota bacterium]